MFCVPPLGLSVYTRREEERTTVERRGAEEEREEEGGGGRRDDDERGRAVFTLYSQAPVLSLSARAVHRGASRVLAPFLFVVLYAR